jgi:hypothetical protein
MFLRRDYDVAKILYVRKTRENVTTFYIKAEPIPGITEEDKTIDEFRVGSNAVELQSSYQMTELGEVKPSWIASWLFRYGQVELRQWHVWRLLTA